MRTQPSDSPALPTKHYRLLPLTGLTNSQYQLVLTTLQQVGGHTLGRPWQLALPVRLLLVLIHLRTNLTTRALAVLFYTSQSSVDRVIHHLAPTLAQILSPEPADHDGTWIIDRTLIPVHDHTRTALSKNYRRSVNTQIVIAKDTRQVVEIGKCWPENRNDVVVARATMPNVMTSSYRCILGDGGYRRINSITGPVRDKSGRIIKDDHWKAHRKVRARVEHSPPFASQKREGPPIRSAQRLANIAAMPKTRHRHRPRPTNHRRALEPQNPNITGQLLDTPSMTSNEAALVRARSNRSQVSQGIVAHT